jgi:hypothetical protein
LGLIRMNVKQHDKPVLSCIETSVHSTVTDQRKSIENLCIQQVTKTPVIIIIDDDKDQLLRMLQRKGIAVEDLAKKSFIESNSSLSVFTQKQPCGYSVFIINEAQGRGLDFLSNSDIE